MTGCGKIAMQTLLHLLLCVVHLCGGVRLSDFFSSNVLRFAFVGVSRCLTFFRQIFMYSFVVVIACLCLVILSVNR